MVLLGTGTPYLVDLGTGVVRQAAAARQKGVLGLDAVALRIGFLTHLHSDHTLGLPDVMLTPWIMRRKRAACPPGTRATVDNVLKAYEADIQLRTAGLEHSNSTGYKVNVHEIEPALSTRTGMWRGRPSPCIMEKYRMPSVIALRPQTGQS